MSETLAELATTDVLLDALANGDLADLRTGDPVLDALSSWVAEIDAQPVPEIDLDPAAASDHPAAGRGWRIAAAAVVVTAMSSSGIAAAATGDPLAPFNYVATALGHLAPTDRADQIRFGMPALNPARPGNGPSQSGPGSTQALDQFWPESINGRHRADSPADYEARHRAAESLQAGGSPDQSGAYQPRHAAADTPASPGSDETPPVDTPTETPPIDTPPAETPPVDTPSDPQPPADPDPGPDPGGSQPPADNAPGDTGGSGGQEQTGYDAGGDTAADTAQVRTEGTAVPAVEAGSEAG